MPALQNNKGNDWSNWRGPQYNGTTVATNLPTKFTNIEWSTDLMGPSHSTPIVHGRYVFTTVANVKQGALQVVALDRKTGKVLWADNLGTGHRSGNEGSVTQLDERSIYAAPSPTTDGKHVWFFFGNGDLGCYTVDGKKVWSRNIQKDSHDFNFMWTFSSSPLLYK
ncbi:MAG: PQQ-binding-like beta-propeller repeat protein, partial [Armatimonadaceae bacterium]